MERDDRQVGVREQAENKNPALPFAHSPHPKSLWQGTVTLLIRTGTRRSETMSDLGKSDSRASLPLTGLTAITL
jgi:hypothetical protein